MYSLFFILFFTSPLALYAFKVKHSIDYNRYMNSKSWQKKRTQVLKRDNYKCFTCGSRGVMHVHHLSYENLGNEKLYQLVSLCDKCHEKIHKAPNRLNYENTRNLQLID